MKVIPTKDCKAAGRKVYAGKPVELDDAVAKELIRHGRARAAPEKPKVAPPRAETKGE